MPRAPIEYIFKLDQTIPQIGKKIALSLANKMNELFRTTKVRQKLIIQTRLAINETLKGSPTYQDIITPGTSLHHELGVKLGQFKLDTILDIWGNSVQVLVTNFRPVGTYGMTGSIHMWAIEASYDDVLGTSAATYISNNAKGEHMFIPWLEWLLLRGRSFVTKGFVYRPGNFPSSRTGFGLMYKRNEGVTKISWQVPSEHSGIADSNWVTRAIFGQDGGIGIAPRLSSVFDQIFRGQ